MRLVVGVVLQGVALVRASCVLLCDRGVLWVVVFRVATGDNERSTGGGVRSRRLRSFQVSRVVSHGALFPDVVRQFGRGVAGACAKCRFVRVREVRVLGGRVSG